ncbi:related to tol protein [Fusarium fujikuroi IMI 58289]|uniref:Related to tol protein n=1 Tax=Gibberella fujikuroi (strain CBS 195.34 / IMI 58289 / NRRL A-6831) TaxID=1279085 RepID=S0EE85_GIBF5|nr:related to tol protein [Fusarium fujikuroi IMI 58289]CCT73114.1 related to tol protein [Fusarium fujikuroi IMI 58289]
MTETLCTSCTQFAADFAEMNVQDANCSRTMSPNIYQLQESAQNGCPLCQITYQCFCYQIPKCYWDQTLAAHLWVHVYSIPLRLDGKFIAPRKGTDKQDPMEPTLSCGVGKDIDRCRWHIISLVMHEENEKRSAEWGLHKKRSIADLSSAEGVEKAITLASSWIQNCSANHDKCRIQPDNCHLRTTKPTRLIDVGSQNGSEGPDDNKHKDDWSYEAARFGQYYENATLTIAATGAISSQQGLFLDRPALLFDPKPVTLKLKKNSGGTRDVSILPPSPLWEMSIRNSPLLTRGWATQERVLSKRILHFGANSLLWECRECKTTEANPESSDPTIFKYQNEQFIDVFQNLENQQKEKLISLWYHFVESYSVTNFSLYKDKLPALSGIAARIQHRFPQEYVAGIWESDIPQGLLWTVWRSQEPEPETIRGTNRPSWCWASSIYPIRFLYIMTYNSDQYIKLQVESWSVRTNGPQTSGQILQGSITVCGPVKSFNLYALGLNFVFGPDAYDKDGNRIVCEASKGVHKVDECTAYLDHMNFLEGVNKTYTCILVATLLPSMWTPAEKRVIGAGLILEPAGRGAVDQYTRIGVLCLPYEQYWADAYYSKILELV